MSKQYMPPIIAAKHPAKVELEAGEDYYWCRCGKSKTGPFVMDPMRDQGLHR